MPVVPLPVVGFWVLLVVVCFLVETRCTLLLCAEAIFRVWVLDLLVVVFPVPVSVELPGVAVLLDEGAVG